MNDVILSLILAATILLPLSLAAGLIGQRWRPLILQLAPWAALPGLILFIFVEQRVAIQIPWLMLGVELRLEPGNDRLFLLLTVLLWLFSGLYARAYVSEKAGRSRFFCFFLLTMAGNFGLVLAHDLLSFYLFFALLSFASYGLVVHERTTEAFEAGSVYIILVVVGEVALFSAFLLTSFSVGSAAFDTIRLQFADIELRNVIILLALVGFGIKAGVAGLHMWLPLAHPVAPTPASAVLSGAMIKAGVIGWLRFLPIGEMTMVTWGGWYIVLGLVAAFGGVLVGVSQTAPKTVLAYSSISQMGLMTIGLGIGLAAPQTAPAIVTTVTLLALHHGLAKGALFLGVGVLSACHGATRRGVWLVLFLPALALAGAPLTSGMAAKLLLKSQATAAPEYWAFWLQYLLPWSSVATTLLVGRFLYLLYSQKNTTIARQPAWGLIWPWAALVVLSMVVPWLYLPAATPRLWSLATIASSSWPVLVGILLMVSVILWRSSAGQRGKEQSAMITDRSVGYRLAHLPPGDLLVPITWLTTACLDAAHRFFSEQLPKWFDRPRGILNQFWGWLSFWQRLKGLETRLRQEPVPLIFLVLLGLLLAGLAAVSWAP